MEEPSILPGHVDTGSIQELLYKQQGFGNKMEREGAASEPEQELIFCFRDFMGSGNLILDRKLLMEHTEQIE